MKIFIGKEIFAVIAVRFHFEMSVNVIVRLVIGSYIEIELDGIHDIIGII